MTGADSVGTDLQIFEASDGLAVRLGRRALTHPARPVAAARKRASSVPIDVNTLYILASPLLFHGFSEFKRRLPDSSIVVCVEQNGTLLEMSRSFAAKGLNGTDVLHSVDPHRTAEMITAIIPATIRRCRLISFGSGASIASEHYREIEQSVTKVLAGRARNTATLIHFGRKWCRHLFRTLIESPVPLPDERIFGSTPVLVAAAGESLETSIPLLKEYREHFRLVAVDAAVGPLAAWGIDPDVVVAVESQSISTGHFHGRLSDASVLVHDLTCHPDVFRLWPPERRFFIATRFADIHLFDRIRSLLARGIYLPGLGSVGITSCAIASRLTEGNIILSGFDFSYVPGKPHAKHSLSFELSHMSAKRLAPDILFELAMARPLIRGTGQDGSSYTSDSVLMSYCPHLGKVLDTERASTLPRTGPDLAIPSAATEMVSTLFRRTIRPDRPLSSIVRDVHAAHGDPSYWHSRTRSFITHERLLLKQARSASSALQTLRDVDYAWIDFPDALDPQLPESEHGKARIRSRIESYTRYLDYLST